MIIQKAGSHLSNPSALSSKMVPTLTENCFPHSRHFHNLRVVRKPALAFWQRGQQVLPLGQRIAATNCIALSASAKYLIASRRVSGKPVSFVMRTISHKIYGESSI